MEQGIKTNRNGKSPLTSDSNWSAIALASIIKLNNIIGYLPISLSEILDAVVNEVYKLYTPHTCCIHMVNEHNLLELVAYKVVDGLKPDVHLNPSADLCMSLRDGLPYIADNENHCPNRKVDHSSSISHVCIPLVSGKDVHGTLSLAYQPKRVLDYERLNVLLAIANQASMAIQRSKLFDSLREEKDEIERAYSEINSLNVELREKMQQLKDAQQRLLQSEKLAAMGKLVAGLSHEINNPISIILNRIECLRMELDDGGFPANIREDLDTMYSYAAKVSSIVQDLLVFSRHYSDGLNVTLINTVIKRVVEMLRPELDRKGCSIKVMNEGAIYVKGDPDRLEQVFYNLVKNAIDAVSDHGEIKLLIGKDSKRKGFARISVVDNGDGIDPEIINRIFDPFFTTKKLGKGTGLGLWICYGIVKNHGGDITVESIKGQGSTFSVYLQIVEK